MCTCSIQISYECLPACQMNVVVFVIIRMSFCIQNVILCLGQTHCGTLYDSAFSRVGLAVVNFLFVSL